ncbi:putative actin-binding LIM protein 1 isoform X8 [Apostichopus japonicus]|uniref:Putative actin-binding LIM protein 1 isoform X8 n=1 Tax=Stichopus japonicus TaxID=307972 RepID=A0A2G8JNE8_STIJA|nr:putative actin-binding LIM protein 1 isoform X8 [Apostichopus japonicus]
MELSAKPCVKPFGGKMLPGPLYMEICFSDPWETFPRPLHPLPRSASDYDISDSLFLLLLRSPLPPGEKVTYNGKDVLCDSCSDDPDGPILSKKETTTMNGTNEAERPIQSEGANIRCFNCGDIISQGQALVALDKHWHVWCFKCTVCKKVLSGEYMGRDGKPYCDRDYHRLYGIKCSLCEVYITGKVLEWYHVRYFITPGGRLFP